MKVRCVNNDNGKLSIDIGETYDVLTEATSLDAYQIKNKNGYDLYYSRNRFEVVKEEKTYKYKCIDNANGRFPLTLGKIYESETSPGPLNWPKVTDDNRFVQMFKPERFEVVEEVSNTDKDLAYARTLLGKEIHTKWGGSFKVVNISILGKDYSSGSISAALESQVKHKDETVALELADGFLYDLSEISEKPVFYELKLNNEYKAKVFNDKLEVGCQTFPITILDDLKKLHEKLV